MKILFILSFFPSVTHAAFSAGSNKPAFTLSDRFKATCPADISTISQFDPSLVNYNQESDEQNTWVAIYRSSNNLPSVLIQDDFLNAMRIATSIQTDGASASPSTAMDSSSLTSQIETSNKKQSPSGIMARTPVAVAKICPSDFSGKWVIENMRCSLIKEDTNDSCDGNSEHSEAISICIDELILYHLKEGREFDGAIRTKATIHQGKLLDERGFKEVEELSRDMATHISSLDSSLMKYAERAVETLSKSPGARDRALKILNYLGRQDPKSEEEKNAEDDSNSDGDDYDPWATATIF